MHNQNTHGATGYDCLIKGRYKQTHIWRNLVTNNLLVVHARQFATDNGELGQIWDFSNGTNIILEP